MDPKNLPRIGTAEEAQTIEHQKTHLPRNLFCDTCAQAKVQRRQTGRKTVLEPDTTERRKNSLINSAPK